MFIFIYLNLFDFAFNTFSRFCLVCDQKSFELLDDQEDGLNFFTKLKLLIFFFIFSTRITQIRTHRADVGLEP